MTYARRTRLTQADKSAGSAILAEGSTVGKGNAEMRGLTLDEANTIIAATFAAARNTNAGR